MAEQRLPGELSDSHVQLGRNRHPRCITKVVSGLRHAWRIALLAASRTGQASTLQGFRGAAAGALRTGRATSPPSHCTGTAAARRIVADNDRQNGVSFSQVLRDAPWLNRRRRRGDGRNTEPASPAAVTTRRATSHKAKTPAWSTPGRRLSSKQNQLRLFPSPPAASPTSAALRREPPSNSQNFFPLGQSSQQRAASSNACR